MKEFVLEATTDVPVANVGAPLAVRERLAAFVELTKPRITFLIVLTSAAGFCLGSKGVFDYLALFNALAGIALLSSGIATLNQYMERGLDARMRRTLSRPLPTGKLSAGQALAFGLALTLVAEVYLALFVNVLTAGFGITVIVGYLLCYTPLKTRSSLSTIVGAFPGAMPPLMGWTAATGHAGLEAWALFAILFAWQFPHFLAIAWMYKEDYARAGIRMLPVVEPACRLTAQQIVIWSLLLVPVSLIPAMLGTTGAVYFYGAFLLGILFLGTSIHAALVHSRQGARRLLLASVLYLPVLFGLMVFNK
ncbi:MAG: heme o synthase [Acidobacteriota bacterium]|jgi:protoheme IX farnesyltransferase|nr:heme o synthase [Acidobacteriota bacterium]